MYNHKYYVRVRPDVLEALDRYAQERVPVGGFLHAVLSNDLIESFGRADSDNITTLFDICRYVYNELPSNCWGTPEIVSEHLGNTTKVVCAWCNTVMSNGVEPISHGMCRECAIKQLEAINEL